jgi:hypothetical protein
MTGAHTFSLDTNAYSLTSHAHAESAITFTDITTNNATTSKHGYLPKLSGSTSEFLRGDGTWVAALELDADLTAIAALSGDGFLKKTSGTWGMDSTLYQTADPNFSSLADLTYASDAFVKMTGAHTFSLDTSTYLTSITKSQVEAVLTGAITSHTHSYEPALGNPAADGRVLSSTAAGVRSWIPIATTDHGALTGLADDDHTQYYNQTRGDARYSLTSHSHLNYATLNVTTNSKTSAYTVVTGDNNKIIECSGTFTVTLPDSMATGFQVTIVNVGTGTITIAASTTLYSKDSNRKLASRWIGATAYHQGSNVWILMGDLTA